MRTFQDMLDTTSDAELGRTVRDRLTRLMDAHTRGVTDEHPAARWNSENEVLRDHYRATRDEANSGLGPRELEEQDQPGAQDDPPEHTPGTPPAPERNGEELAADHAREELAIRQRAGADMEGELALARARRSNLADVVALAAAIPGYNRIK
jgi:hypothetical protein